MAGKLQPLLSGSRALTIVSTPPRKVQLPARTFQLLARKSYNAPECRSNPVYQASLHTTTRSLRKQSPGSIQTDHHVKTQPSTNSTLTAQEPKSESLPINEAPKIGKNTHEKHKEDYTVRHYMRHVTHPVAIITSADTSIDAEGGPSTWRGATVSSFNSVTLDPIPYVSFNIKKLSSTYEAMQNSNLFAVHLMSNTPEAVELATHFSRGNDAAPFHKQPPADADGGTPKLHSFVSILENWLPFARDRGSLPPTIWWHYKAHTRAVIFQFLCEFQKDKVTEVGDHVIVIGKVLAKSGPMDDEQEFAKHGSNVPTQGLTYVNGSYSRKNKSRWLNLVSAKGSEREEISQVADSRADTRLKIKKASNLVIRRYGAAPR